MGMYSKSAQLTAIAVVLCLLASPSTSGRASIDYEKGEDFAHQFSSVIVAHGIVGHRIGKIVLAVNNNGTFGTGFAAGAPTDWFTGQAVPSCEYPKLSNVRYLFAGAFWIGAIVGRDTLVSVAADGWSYVREMFPDRAPFGEIIKRSIRDPNSPMYEGAVSEEDYIMVYADTFTDDIGLDYFGRPHVPLHIEVTQRSYAWSYPYAEDFVLFDYEIKNIGGNRLENVYMGVYVDADVFYEGGSSASTGYTDDICGFKDTLTAPYGCGFVDTVNIAWIADNDGDPIGSIFSDQSCPGVTATRIIRTPADSLDVSFNWWISNGSALLDFGPRERARMGKWKEDFRDYQTGGTGTPEGDVNKYYIMRNREFDYDQARTATIGADDTLWCEPIPDLAGGWADGFDTRYTLSFGPFDINPGERLPVSLAYVGGEDLHTIASNIDNLPNDPDEYYRNIDFSDLGLNAAWASRVYDNPGIDTDGNGYAGKYRICCLDTSYILVDTNINGRDTTIEVPVYDLCDTIWYEGDGVPDFRGAAPPPAPDFWLDPAVGSIHVRFNGLRSETTRDVFSRIIDFEGYRVYVARDERASSFSVVASYDIENYNKYVWDERRRPFAGYSLFDIPFSLGSLRCLYADSCNDTTWHPLNFTRSAPYIHEIYPDSIFYFERQDFNASDFGVTTPIRKRYPDEPYPSSLIPDSARPDERTEDGCLRYFEYEFQIENLLPSVPYWVNVTAFDFGSPESNLQALESSVSIGTRHAYPLSSFNEVQSNNLKVYVYPNPYRVDAGYRSSGFEGRTEDDRPDDRVRAVHFANLPPRCIIRIYSLDGDMIREIEHDKAPSDPTATHDEWDLITKNTQMIVSGIYYWTVESDYSETQVGKLVVIM